MESGQPSGLTGEIIGATQDLKAWNVNTDGKCTVGMKLIFMIK